MARVTFYYDGFNFYNGLSDHSRTFPIWKNFYWIDFVALARQFYNEDEIVCVKYFTAPPLNIEKRSRQSALFGANKIINGDRFVVHNGIYIDKTIDCKLCSGTFKVPEEKRTDVGIAVNMLLDCINDRADTLVLVSADTDQVPTIKAIKEQYPNKKIKVHFPPSRESQEILSIAKPVIYMQEFEKKFNQAKMPGEVKVGDKKYTRPSEWKAI